MKNCPSKRLSLFSKKFLCLSIGLVVSQNAFSFSYLTPNQRLGVFEQYYKVGFGHLRVTIQAALDKVSTIEKQLLNDISQDDETGTGHGFGVIHFDKNDPNSIQKLTDALVGLKINKVTQALDNINTYLDQLEGINRTISIVEGYETIIRDAQQLFGSEVVKHLTKGQYKEAVKSMANFIVSGDGTLLENIQDAIETGKDIFYDTPKKALYDLPKEAIEVINLFNSIPQDNISEEYKRQFLNNSISIAADQLKSLYQTDAGKRFYAQELIIKKLKYAGITDEELKDQIIIKSEFHDGFWSKSWSFTKDTYENVMIKKQAAQYDVSFGKSKSEIEAEREAARKASREAERITARIIRENRERREKEVREEWERWNKAIGDYATNKVNDTVNELRNTFDSLSNDLKKRIEENDKRNINAKLRNPISSENPSPTAQDDTTTTQTKPNQNNTSDNIASTDPNHHGTTSTQDNGNDLAPAPSPSGSDATPPYKAPDLTKAKELWTKINNFKKIRDNLIYNFKHRTEQINTAIKEKRVNDETINIAKNANIDRKSALEFDQKISELEKEYAQLIGAHNFSYQPISIGNPIDVNSLQRLVSNDKNTPQQYKDLAEWGNIDIDFSEHSFFDGDFTGDKFFIGTPLDDIPKKGTALYEGDASGRTIARHKDTGEIFNSYSYDSDFNLYADFNNQKVTPILLNFKIKDYVIPKPRGDKEYTYERDMAYSDLDISDFNGSAGFKGTSHNIKKYCVDVYCYDQEYQFAGVFSSDSNIVSGVYKGKTSYFASGGYENLKAITLDIESAGVFGAKKIDKPDRGRRTSALYYDDIGLWGGISIRQDIPFYVKQKEVDIHDSYVMSTPLDQLPQKGTANYQGESRMQVFNNRQAGQKYSSDFNMSVDFNAQTVNPRLSNISGDTGFFDGDSHDFGQISIDALTTPDRGQFAGFKDSHNMSNGNISSIAGVFLGYEGEEGTAGVFEIKKDNSSKLQGSFYGEKQ